MFDKSCTIDWSRDGSSGLTRSCLDEDEVDEDIDERLEDVEEDTDKDCVGRCERGCDDDAEVAGWDGRIRVIGWPE